LKKLVWPGQRLFYLHLLIKIKINKRELLQEEIDTLMQDVEFLYECLDGETDYRANTCLHIKEPTLSELKDERKRLEADLLSSTGKNQYEVSKILEVVNSDRSSVTRSPLTRLRTPPTPSSAGSSLRSSIPTNASNNVDNNTTITIIPPAKTTSTTTINSGSRSSLSPQLKKPQIAKTVRTGQQQQQNVSITNRSSSLVKPSRLNASNGEQPAVVISGKQQQRLPILNNGNATEFLRHQQTPPMINRSNSVISNASSVGSSASSSNFSSPTSTTAAAAAQQKQTAAQKLRQLVLEHRD
jgi:hypothetical protein